MYLAAIVSSVSFEVTVTTSPLIGGIVRTWPRWSSSLESSLFAHHNVIIETSNLSAMPVSVSPDFTL